VKKTFAARILLEKQAVAHLLHRVIPVRTLSPYSDTKRAAYSVLETGLGRSFLRSPPTSFVVTRRWSCGSTNFDLLLSVLCVVMFVSNQAEPTRDEGGSVLIWLYSVQPLSPLLLCGEQSPKKTITTATRRSQIRTPLKMRITKRRRAGVLQT